MTFSPGVWIALIGLARAILKLIQTNQEKKCNKLTTEKVKSFTKELNSATKSGDTTNIEKAFKDLSISGSD